MYYSYYKLSNYTPDMNKIPQKKSADIVRMSNDGMNFSMVTILRL